MMSKKKDIWNGIIRNLASKLPKSEFETWFSETTLEELNNELAIIGVPNKFVSNWLQDKYIIEITKSFKKVLEFSPDIHFSYTQP